MDQSPPEGPGAAQDLAPRVYAELRRLAGAYMRRERPGQTLQATALVHEVYLRLAGAGTPWQDERHFVGIAARSMRQILVERARARGAQKRWAGLDRVSVAEQFAAAHQDVEARDRELQHRMTELDNALNENHHDRRVDDEYSETMSVIRRLTEPVESAPWPAIDDARLSTVPPYEFQP